MRERDVLYLHVHIYNVHAYFYTINACELDTGTSWRYWMHTYALTKKPNNIAGNGQLLAKGNSERGHFLLKKNWICLIVLDYLYM